jgi:hypothetical protein
MVSTPRLVSAAALAAALSAAGRVAAQAPAADALAGSWRGSSVCLVNRGVCHDETVVYHVAPADSAGYLVTMNKLVGGEEEEMDVLRCTADAAFVRLSCPLPPGRRPGTFAFTRAGDALDGWLLAPDGTRVREIHVARVR